MATKASAFRFASRRSGEFVSLGRYLSHSVCSQQ